MPSYGEEGLSLIVAARARRPARPVEVSSIQLSFSAPQHGWLDFALSSGDQRARMDFSHVLDPFRDWPTHDNVETSFIRWLEHIVEGEHPTLVVEAEGPWFIALTEPIDTTRIRVSAGESGDFTFDIAIDRLAFIRDFYRQLVGFWESETLSKAWPHWGRAGEAQWSLRSAHIEKAIG